MRSARLLALVCVVTGTDDDTAPPSAVRVRRIANPTPPRPDDRHYRPWKGFFNARNRGIGRVVIVEHNTRGSSSVRRVVGRWADETGSNVAHTIASSSARDDDGDDDEGARLRRPLPMALGMVTGCPEEVVPAPNVFALDWTCGLSTYLNAARAASWRRRTTYVAVLTSPLDYAVRSFYRLHTADHMSERVPLARHFAAQSGNFSHDHLQHIQASSNAVHQPLPPLTRPPPSALRGAKAVPPGQIGKAQQLLARL